MIYFDSIIKTSDKVLVVAPHPDDETIGLGGLLILYGEQIDLLVLTDGSKGNYKGSNLSKEQLSNTRKDELRKALSFTKVANVYFLEIEDGEVVNYKTVISTFDFLQYNYIFVPNRHESHIDHKYAFNYISRLIDRFKTNLVEYEVWSPIANPNCFLDISNVFDIKRQMINTYKTQLISNNYNQLISGLNMYRGLLIHKEFAEAYSLSVKKERRKKMKHIIIRIKGLMNHNG